MASDKRVSKRGHPGGMASSCLRPRPLAVATAIALLPWTSQVFALPTGEKTLFGNVDYSRPNNQTMNINVTTPSGGSSFTSFSIDAGQTVNIQQLSASSTYLIKDVGGMASQIYGVLNANGQVFMSNTSGVFFARGAEVNVGALFATSLNINPVDFAAGRYNFYRDGSAGTVVNQGLITASAYAALAGPQVRNDGVIVARAGTVALAAGDRVSLDMIGDGLIKVSVDQAALNAAAINTGRIEADGGNVLLTARSANALLDTVVNNSGVIRANSLVERNGEIILDGGSAGMVTNSGTLQAMGKDTGLTGGTVKVLGERIALFKGTAIDASGNAGGGTVLIGGNYQGNGPEANASRTYVEAGARINADAIRNGDGGNVIVWSEQQTVFDAAISTRGGRQSGNGGFVEVSGKHYLSFTGTADRRAPHGRAGTLLLDPTDMIITAAGGAVSCFLGVCSDNGDTSMLSTSVLQAALAGGDVNVNATAGAGAGSGTINWTDGSVNAGGNSLTLTGSTITFNGTLTNLNNLTFAGNGGTVSGAGSALSVGGSVTGIGNATFDITGLNAGTAGGISFSGFTAADSQSVTGAVNFDHGARSSEAMTFAAVTSVSGAGGITNMGATAFNLTGVAQGNASGVSYSGFTAADTTTVTGASGFDHGAKSSLGMTFASATSVSGTGGITNMGVTAFHVTGVTQGTAGGASYSGFTTADTTTVTSAPGFDHTAKTTAGMVFANATSVSGTGGITNMGASAFNVTGVTQGTAGGVSYSGFTTADTTTVTSAPGFDDTAKTTAGMVFANASSVSGTGTISNVVNDFNDSTRLSSGSGITYGAGFTALTTLNGGDITGTPTFALTGPNAGTAASGDTYTGFGSSSSASTVTGASGFDHGAKSSLGMTFAAATSVSGTGGITNMGATAFDVTGITQGNAGGITYSGFTAADTTTVTSAPGFDDAAKSTSGITFANATSVFGSGAISNVTGDFDDSSRLSSASLITYGSGFTSVAGTLAGSVKGTTTFNLGGANSGTADSGDTYSGFGASTASTVNGASGFNDTTKVTQGMTFASATAVNGTGAITAVAGDFDDSTRVSSASLITYGSAFTSVTGTLAGSVTGTATFNLTGANAGTADSGDTYTGFGASSATTVSGASGFNHGAKTSLGMTFAAATSVSGSGGITNMGATAFDVTGATQGTAGGVSYSGFSAADTTTVTGAPGFDDAAKSTSGITFANATSVSGAGAITNVTGDFNDTTRISSASLISYGSGFTSVAGTLAGSVTGTTNFNLTGANAGTADSGDTYSGFGASTAGTVNGASGFNDTTKVTQGMTFASATSVNGTGAIIGVAGDFNDSTRLSSASLITYGSGFTSVAGTIAGTVTGTTSFHLTAANAGIADSGDTYTGFGASTASTVTGASGFNHGAKSSLGMTFAAATNVSGSGGISNMGASGFNVTGVTQGTAGGVSYSGFTTADTTTVTGAPGFDDTAKTTAGIVFANASSVSGTGTITNVVSNFNDTTRLSSGSGITYGTAFTALTTLNGGDITGTASFAMSGPNAGTAASGDTYTGFGSSSSATTVSGASGFNHGAKSSLGMTFLAATSVSGTGGITNMGATAFDVTGITQGNAGGITYSGFTTADTTTVTSAPGFDDTAKTTAGMFFANASSVAGTGTISNVVSNFNDTTRLSSGSGITYGAGFTALTTLNGGDITGTASFALTGVNAGTAASGDAYTGFGSSSSASTVSGASGFNDTARTSLGMTFAAATNVSGSGTITNVVSNFNDTTRVSSGSGITYGAAFTGLTTLNGGNITGTATFALTGANAGTAASGDTYAGFGASSSATTLSGASGFNHAAKSSLGMTFAAATTVSGSGGITNMGATAFNVTGTTQGSAGPISYSGFTAADTTSVTNAPGFNDGGKATAGMTFANSTTVTGTGTISNVAGAFNDATQISTASGIDYAGFNTVSGSGTTLNGVTGSFNDSTRVSAATGINYAGFALTTVNGTGGNVNGIAGTFNVTSKISAASGINYSGFGVSTVSGTGPGATITGSGLTYTLANATPNAGSSAGVTWSAFPNISDPTGTLNMQASGSVTGNVTAQTIDYSSYISSVTIDLSGAAHASTGIGGTRSAVTTIIGSGNNDTVTGSFATYNLTSQNAGNSAGLNWTSFENISDLGSIATFNLFVSDKNVTGTLSSGGSATLNSPSQITHLDVSVPFTLTLLGTAPTWNLTGAPHPNFFETNNPQANVVFNGVCIGGPACGAVIAIVGSINASVSQIAAQALKDAQATDSVAKQIDYGFAGDVGTTPPMDHRIDETGISTPDCFDESREGQACKAN